MHHLNNMEDSIIQATSSGDLMRMRAILQQTNALLKTDKLLKDMERQDSLFTMKVVSALAVLKTEITKLERLG